MLGGRAELRELAARLVKVAAEALQVLLHELRHLREQHRADDAQHAINQSVAGAEQALGDFHGVNIGVGKTQRPTSAIMAAE